ncbi:type II secretion system F family protein [Alcaligenes sp. WGS1538]|uniref:type II secretion system F family protein n=1 Tax=Alcaligenes sp. WGS1538 TaxID=3366811 RepID=UPI00372D36DF
MTALLIALAAVLLILGAMLLWRQAGRRQQAQISAKVLERQLALRPGVPLATREERVQQDAWQGAPKGWREFMLRTGMRPSRRFYFALLAWTLGLPVLLLALVGPVAGAAMLAAAIAGAYAFLWFKTDRRHRKIVAQIPDFLDLMVRLITIGNSMGAAFLNAADNTPLPLGEVLQEAKALHRSGQELDAALRTVSRQHGLHELFLVAAVIGVAMRFGGRSDQTMERMAGFMRDRENARNELVALSAEVRLSAWILALLPAVIAVYILIFNNNLFMTMWQDPTGFRMLVFAVVLQLVGCYWLYRMARNV